MGAYRLLAIEDNQNIADMICRAASDMGFQTQSTDGGHAAEIYQSFKPDIIVLDILMPEKDGLEVLQFLKESKCQAHIVILSGSSDAYRKIAERLGTANGLNIVGNLSKPFRINELRMILTQISTTFDTLNARRQGTA